MVILSNINGENQQVADEVQEDAKEQLIEERTKLFLNFINFCEENNVPVDSNEFRLISEFATRDGVVPLIKQKVSNLGDLQVEELTEREINLILRRARLGLKRIVEQRARYHRKENPDGTVTVFGPHFEHHSRKHRRYIMSKILKRTKSSSRASEIVKEFKSRRTVVQST